MEPEAVRTFFIVGFNKDSFWMEEESRNIPCCMVPCHPWPYTTPFTPKPPFFVTYEGPREAACAGPFEFAIEAWDYAVARGGIWAIPRDGWIVVVDKKGRGMFGTFCDLPWEILTFER